MKSSSGESIGVTRSKMYAHTSTSQVIYNTLWLGYHKQRNLPIQPDRLPGPEFQPPFSAVLDDFFTCSTLTIMYDISKKKKNIYIYIWVDSDCVKSERFAILDCT